MAGQPDAQLYERLVDLLGAHDVHPDDRIDIQQALATATTWNDLPQPLRLRIEELERTLERQAWADPSDIPGND
ncbi:hypothetical protein [Dactylosporangium salmoneum]|uniref:Uncharacterized protein n=1 Tax=Dactylosporangium salmoneum TaxID=53361 RepID=A0ABN3FDN8_9ACTN